MLSVQDKIDKGEEFKAKGSAHVKEKKYKRAIAKYSTVFAYINVRKMAFLMIPPLPPLVLYWFETGKEFDGSRMVGQGAVDDKQT
jgi:hypothetical protein